MGRKVTFDLDKLIASAERVAPKMPTLFNMLVSQFPQAKGLLPFVEMGPALVEVMADLVGKPAEEADKIPSLPVVSGENGRGRGQYLRRSHEWTDEQIIGAFDIVMSRAGESGGPVMQTIAHTERCMYGRSASNPQERRKAIEAILDSEDALPTATADQIAAHMFYLINNQPKQE